MSKKEKLISKIKNNPKNVSFETLEKILTQNAWKCQSVKGSHHTFFKEGYKNIVLPLKKPMNEIYVKEVLKALDSITE